ncbi:MAG: triphosphoribosyl-dephospho-CoA synthase [Gemmataceae bacterium]
MTRIERIRAAAMVCQWEVMARKLGNVHPQARFVDMTVTDFLLSAVLLAEAFTEATTTGTAIAGAIHRTRTIVGKNTNLGIILLLAPLVYSESVEELPAELDRIDLAETGLIYDAIRQLNPGGLGKAPEHDIRSVPTERLMVAMRAASGRDQVAKQYATAFAELRDHWAPRLVQRFHESGSVEFALLQTQLELLAAEHDTLIERKCGEALAHEVQQRAANVLASGGLLAPAGFAAWKELDTFLRADGHRRNPGTTADLLTACLFIGHREHKLSLQAQFPWPKLDGC